jgi:hypothetical protein
MAVSSALNGLLPLTTTTHTFTLLPSSPNPTITSVATRAIAAALYRPPKPPPLPTKIGEEQHATIQRLSQLGTAFKENLLLASCHRDQQMDQVAYLLAACHGNRRIKNTSFEINPYSWRAVELFHNYLADYADTEPEQKRATLQPLQEATNQIRESIKGGYNRNFPKEIRERAVSIHQDRTKQMKAYQEEIQALEDKRAQVPLMEKAGFTTKIALIETTAQKFLNTAKATQAVVKEETIRPYIQGLTKRVFSLLPNQSFFLFTSLTIDTGNGGYGIHGIEIPYFVEFIRREGGSYDLNLYMPEQESHAQGVVLTRDGREWIRPFTQYKNIPAQALFYTTSTTDPKPDFFRLLLEPALLENSYPPT